MLGNVTRRAGAPSPAPGIGLISTGYHNTDATHPKSPHRRRMLRFAAEEGCWYAGPPSGDRAETPGGAPEPASA